MFVYYVYTTLQRQQCMTYTIFYVQCYIDLFYLLTIPALQHYRVGMHLILYNISIIIACHLPGTHAAVILVYKHSIHHWISNILWARGSVAHM